MEHDAGRAEPRPRWLALTAEPAETVAILGPSGSGKSTLLNIICLRSTGLGITASANRRDRPRRTAAAFRAREVGLPSGPPPAALLTAIENVALPALAADHRGAADRARALLGVWARWAGGGLPAGARRAPASRPRALINGARLLLCDEPTGNLDRETGARLVEMLRELASDGVTVLMVTHNTEQAALLDRRLLLRAGTLAPWEEAAKGAGA